MVRKERFSSGKSLSSKVKSSARFKVIADEMRRYWYRLKQSRLSLVGLAMVGFIIFLAVFADYVAPYPEAAEKTDFSKRLLPPSWENWCGTDSVGRDILSRIIFGTRVALLVGILVLLIANGIGVPLGIIAGYYGGLVNLVIMRVTDIFLAVPGLALAIVVGAALGPNLTNAIIAIAFVWWPWYTRLIQGEVLSIKEELFVEAARATGASGTRIAFREILPNLVSPIVVKSSMDIGFAILIASGLSFLGLGSQEPTPDWGLMMMVGRNVLPKSWWYSAFPGFAILFTVLAFNLLGDGLRDMFAEE